MTTYIDKFMELPGASQIVVGLITAVVLFVAVEFVTEGLYWVIMSLSIKC